MSLYTLIILKWISIFTFLISWSNLPCSTCRGCWKQDQVADLMASAPAALLHRPKLCQASLGEILHALLHTVHCMDRSLLILHGLDGKFLFAVILLLLYSLLNKVVLYVNILLKSQWSTSCVCFCCIKQSCKLLALNFSAYFSLKCRRVMSSCGKYPQTWHFQLTEWSWFAAFLGMHFYIKCTKSLSKYCDILVVLKNSLSILWSALGVNYHGVSDVNMLVVVFSVLQS